MVVVKISNIGQREARAIFGVAKWPELARMHSTEMSSCIPDLYSSAVMDCAGQSVKRRPRPRRPHIDIGRKFRSRTIIDQ